MKKPLPKFVQILTTVDYVCLDSNMMADRDLLALAADGSVWLYKPLKGWKQLKMVRLD